MSKPSARPSTTLPVSAAEQATTLLLSRLFFLHGVFCPEVEALCRPPNWTLWKSKVLNRGIGCGDAPHGLLIYTYRKLHDQLIGFRSNLHIARST
jgi:hypothetical protein